MKNIIMAIFVLAVLPIASAQQAVYQVELVYDNGRISIDNITLTESFPPDNVIVPDSGYKIELLSTKNEELFEHVFNFPLEVIAEPSLNCYDPQTLELKPELCQENERGGYFVLDQASTLVNVPFSPAGKAINVYDPSGNLVATRNVLSLSCGNLVCDEHESVRSCPGDCSMENDAGIVEGKDNTMLLVTGIIILAIITLAVILISIPGRKRKQEDWGKLYRKIRK